MDCPVCGIRTTKLSLERKGKQIDAVASDKESLVRRIEKLVASDRACLTALKEEASRRQEQVLRQRAPALARLQSCIDRTKMSAARSTETYSQTLHGLLRIRRQLVKDLLSIFRLRRVLRRRAPGSGAMSGESLVDQVEFRVLHVGFSIYGNLPQLSSQQREKLNAVVGYAVQLTLLLAHYLGIKLPYEICWAGSRSFVRQAFTTNLDHGTRPLHSTESNSEGFVAGLALLNYDIVYLCYTQGVIIPLERSVYLLENLAACCQAPELGREFERLRGRPREEAHLFHLEASMVIQLHAACWSTGKPWELVTVPPLLSQRPSQPPSALPVPAAELEKNDMGVQSGNDQADGWDMLDYSGGEDGG
ncbi:hypothetical protein HK105_204021 [Polyrhizophydium stewartii]|uniref:Autophagy-related protein 14 n=1 Tax=Polyrhizophydium stewartii TaxID=2732419 RepID=A0ABR4N9Q7_9FUNG